MASNDREERRLARQRGAGTREVKASNFGFTFGASAAAPAPRARTKTPQPTSAVKATRATPSLPSTSGSKRKTPGSTIRIASILRRSTRSRAVSNDVETAVDNLSTSTPVVTASRPDLDSAVQQTVQRQSPATGSKRKRTPLIEQATPAGLESIDELENNDEEQQLARARTPASTTSARSVKVVTGIAPGSAAAATVEDELFEPETSTANVPRSSSVARPTPTVPRSRRKATKAVSPTISTPEQPPATAQAVSVEQFDPEVAQTSSLSPVPPEAPPIDEDSGDELSPNQPRARASGKHKKRKSDKVGTTTTKKPKRTRDLSDGASVPITVYRPIVPEDSILQDPLGEELYPRQTASDVLNQITTEMITDYTTRLEAKSTRRTSTIGSQQQSSQPSSQDAKMLKRHRKYLQAFQRVLKDQLFGVSSVANTASVLEARVRRTRKEVVTLREELMQVKNERYTVEVQKDELRVQHLRTVETERRQRELHESISDIRAAMVRGREQAEREGRMDEGPGKDSKFERYRYVLGRMDGGGIAKRVEECNAMMQSRIGGRVS